MTFSNALDLLKQGKTITRTGWNGKQQYLVLVENISYQLPNGEIVNGNHNTMGNCAIAFVGTQGVQVGWLASQADLLSDDWKEMMEVPTNFNHEITLDNPMERVKHIINEVITLAGEFLSLNDVSNMNLKELDKQIGLLLDFVQMYQDSVRKIKRIEKCIKFPCEK